MKKTLLTVALLSLTALNVQASDVTYEIGIKNDYRLNGISFSDKDPVVQGKIEYVNPDHGWYLGTWATSTGGNEATDAEVEVFGGKRHIFENKIALDVGLVANTYHGDSVSNDLNYNEVLVALNYEGFTGSVAYTNDFLGLDFHQLVSTVSYTQPLSKGFLKLSASHIDNEENIYFGDDAYMAWEVKYLHPVSDDLDLTLAYVGTDISNRLDVENQAQDGVVAGLNWKF